MLSITGKCELHQYEAGGNPYLELHPIKVPYPIDERLVLGW